MAGDRSGLALPPGVLTPVPVDLDATCICRAAWTTIGKKYLMAIAGLVWCLFVVAHLLGNMTFYGGPEMYNGYSAHLLSLGPILIVLEAGLVFFLLLHSILAILTTLENRAARPVKYDLCVGKGGKTTASRTMIWTGLLIVFFLVVHLLNFKYAEHAKVNGLLDLYSSVVDHFRYLPYAAGYVIAVSIVGLHVSHALQSSLRTLGWNGERSYPVVNRISRLFGLVVALGYASMPIVVLLTKGGA
jgi:succinate dehydrogenase / fumarate reductase, cytochrome b subunit